MALEAQRKPELALGQTVVILQLIRLLFLLAEALVHLFTLGHHQAVQVAAIPAAVQAVLEVYQGKVLVAVVLQARALQAAEAVPAG